MAAQQTKRQLPAKVAATKSNKRRKVDSDAATFKGPKVTAAPKKSAPVRLDELPWSEVTMPDRLDGFEGFFGLEEIDDVAVIKEEGKVTYQAVGKLAKAAPVATDKTHDQVDATEEEEFAGFSDNDDSAPEAKTGILKASKQESKKQPAAKKAKRDTPKPTKNKKTESTSFPTMSDDAADEGVDVSAWRALGLSPDTMASLSRLKFSKPTPIQSAAIPEINAGHDVIGKASTGSGKTLAFGIPIFETYLERRSRQPLPQKAPVDSEHPKTPLALILSPTRELAHQLTAHLTDLFAGLPTAAPMVTTVTGGLSLQKQQRQLKTADVIVGTPGRLWEVIGSGHGTVKWLKKIKYLVIDEADRLLSQGHFKELEEILNVLDRDDAPEQDDSNTETAVTSAVPESDGERQTLIFSATFGKELQQKLANKQRPGAGQQTQEESMEYLLKKLNFREEKPKFIDVNPRSQMATGLKEGLVECAGLEKDLYLYSLLLLHSSLRTLVFTNSISAVRRLTPYLQNLGLPVLPLHSQMAQKARLRSIERFTGTDKAHAAAAKANRGSILVATDVAARGLDIRNVQLVIHYHLPRTADAYVHRSGRTARAGETGSSILICGPEEVAGVRRLVAKVHASSAATRSSAAETDAARHGYYIRTLDIDRRVVARLKPRSTLAKQLADVNTAKEKKHSENDFLREAAEDLGVEYDSEEFEKTATGKRGRGAGREKKEREARSLTKDEVKGLRWELNQLLKQRVNVGVSERYLTAGGIDIDELLRQGDSSNGEFLGSVNGIGLDD